MYQDQNALKLAHRYLTQQVRPGSICVDATAGRGKDTEFLCRLTGETGHVYAFDVQQEALESTAARLRQAGLDATLILDGHEALLRYITQADVIVFNFGYLPGSDHSVRTQASTSTAAIQAAMQALRPGGCICMCIYYGGISGFEERDAILELLRSVDASRFTVMVQEFVNRPNCPPIFSCIECNEM